MSDLCTCGATRGGGGQHMAGCPALKYSMTPNSLVEDLRKFAAIGEAGSAVNRLGTLAADEIERLTQDVEWWKSTCKAVDEGRWETIDRLRAVLRAMWDTSEDRSLAPNLTFEMWLEDWLERSADFSGESR